MTDHQRAVVNMLAQIQAADKVIAARQHARAEMMQALAQLLAMPAEASTVARAA